MKVQLDIMAHVTQLAIAPVFLLTGIGAPLGVMTQRIARIVDRARDLEEAFPIAAPTVLRPPASSDARCRAACAR